MQTLWQHIVQFQKKSVCPLRLWQFNQTAHGQSQVDEKGGLLEA
jgi:hypothetical protein